QNFEQNIINLKETIQCSYNTEKIDNIQKYLSTLFSAFCELDSLSEKLSNFTLYALSMNVK
ncbi:hypothetical protein EMPG_14892, partial [Blastomyces silverae]